LARDRLPVEPETCTCLAIRQAARRVTQFYDQQLGPTGLRITQFSILAKLRQFGPMTINNLAGLLVMDRTTLGRNIMPLEREGLIKAKPGRQDRRSKELEVTEAGVARLRAARGRWRQAQARFEEVFGQQKTLGLRALLHEVTATELPDSISARPQNGRRSNREH
jgi:DNA-binding MarR family transcriptional regulator